jgi:hypothetical protein
MKKLLLALAGGVAALALFAALATAFPLPALLLRLALESLRPQVISWEAKNAWQKCEDAIGGAIAWPSTPASACAAMHMCANEAELTTEQRTSLVSAVRRLPDCGDP